MKTIEATLQPRDVVKLAFQFQETEFVPYDDLMLYEHDQALSAWFGDEHWREQHSVSYLGALTGFDGSLTLAGMTPQPDGTQKDILGCSWRMGNISHLEDWPLHEPEMGDYRLPGLQPYFEQYVKPRWPREIAQSANRFRICWTVFGLFERAWTLRGFENFLVDLALNEKFAEQLLDHITEYLLQSVDLMAQAPLDSICFTDDHACQRGMIMGADRWRRLFKPR
ncbi:MAG TPA: hypothetical protein PLD73_17310 [Candidatus Hydrogenedentes bacterium]|nr:hypothetical protein [Candidatus Hydrogenedentota bacterium]HPK02906.1 hypothetical protein [Candidatus Sumerlaeota bacterium]